MIVSISQPRYLPWLGYFHRIAVSNLFIYLDTVQYTPRDWENRNRVKTNRDWVWLTVPVKARYRALISEVLINNESPWQRKHWGTIKTYYSAAPYFHLYSERLSEVYLKQTWNSLVELNLSLIDIMYECLGIKQSRFIKASEIGAQGKGSELILNLCKKVGAKIYLSGSEGRNYLDESAFSEAGIKLVYQDYRHTVYPQLFGKFKPYMALLDLLFNCGPQSQEVLMKGQNAVKT